MFDPSISVDAVFDTLGIDAIMDPDALAAPVKLMPREADDLREFGGIEIITATGLYEIRKADFAGHGDGTILEIDGDRRKVQSHTVRDPRRLKVVLNTVAAV